MGSGFRFDVYMRQALRLHPDSSGAVATRVEVDVSVPRSGNLVLRYFVTGKMSDLRMPPVTASKRSDELWQHTCFEAFMCAPPAQIYYEFNFAPSTQWAAYRFSGYRSGMSVASEIEAPRFEVRSGADHFEMQVSLDLNRLSNLVSNAVWRLGLAAIIEDASGEKSYWALAHPPGKPDFHDAGCFAHELAAADYA